MVWGSSQVGQWPPGPSLRMNSPHSQRCWPSWRVWQVSHS